MHEHSYGRRPRDGRVVAGLGDRVVAGPDEVEMPPQPEVAAVAGSTALLPPTLDPNPSASFFARQTVSFSRTSFISQAR